jgi:hypothetical protein
MVLILRKNWIIALLSVHKFDDAQKPSITFFPLSFCRPPSHMTSSPLPQWHTLTKLSHDHISCRRNVFVRSFNSIPGFGIFFGAFLLVCLVLYMTLVSPPGLLLLHSPDWHGLGTNSTGHVSTPTNHDPSLPASDGAPSSPSVILSLEQIRDIVAPTRGFLARDYSLHIGWNNVSICGSQF